MTNRRLSLLLGSALLSLAATAQTADVETGLKAYFANYDYRAAGLSRQPALKSCAIDSVQRTITVTADEYFAQQVFTEKKLHQMTRDVRDLLPEDYQDYELILRTDGRRISDLVAEEQQPAKRRMAGWGSTDYKGQPWVTNMSRPTTFKRGLQGRHVAVWASHGRYYDTKKEKWAWQRPNLFCTNEDLFTQTFVLPYLIPMLERAGAVVWTPRERDWQPEELIVDNDHPSSGYAEEKPWKDAPEAGFSLHGGTYADGENPFTAGTARQYKTTSKIDKATLAVYRPAIAESGRYAVYVSYQTVKQSIDQAEYFVCHQGVMTRFLVNQQMGGGTWVYLGTFDFDADDKQNNYVAVSNYSKDKGIVTTDAVRFGGGMGNIERGGTTSGLPRFAEGARYSAQWYGAPQSIVSIFEGTNDYNDDINCRSLMENWVAGGSTYVPNRNGLGVPLELSLAVHSDDGYRKDDSAVGTLTICTTSYRGNDLLNSGLERTTSYDFASSLLRQVCSDIETSYGVTWPNRTVWDKNYNECRRPEVPSSILEMLAHQNFGDMRMGHDPNFKFTLARAAYKTMARFIARQHGQTVEIAPLAPTAFRLKLAGTKLSLAWNAQDDQLESSATPRAYILYSSTGTGGFGNGTLVSKASAERTLSPDVEHSYCVSAVNDGGESFPSETLSAVSHPGATKTILVVNGFHRLAGPAVVNTDDERGFDLDADPGVSYLRTAGWTGRQTCFDASQGGKEGVGALGYGRDELAGSIIAGNTFDYVRDHVAAIQSAGEYNIVSCSAEAVEQGLVALSDYDAVDLILGLEKNDGYSLVSYKSFPPALQTALRNYTAQGGRLLVSGSYVGSDMQSDEEREFLASVLKTTWDGRQLSSSAATVTGMGRQMSIYNKVNAQHYAATHPDVLSPTGSAFTTLQYGDGRSAAVAYQGADYRTITLGFPWECIKDQKARQSLMRGFLQFLMKE